MGVWKVGRMIRFWRISDNRSGFWLWRKSDMILKWLLLSHVWESYVGPWRESLEVIRKERRKSTDFILTLLKSSFFFFYKKLIEAPSCAAAVSQQEGKSRSSHPLGKKYQSQGSSLTSYARESKKEPKNWHIRLTVISYFQLPSRFFIILSYKRLRADEEQTQWASTIKFKMGILYRIETRDSAGHSEALRKGSKFWKLHIRSFHNQGEKGWGEREFRILWTT